MENSQSTSFNIVQVDNITSLGSLNQINKSDLSASKKQISKTPFKNGSKADSDDVIVISDCDNDEDMKNTNKSSLSNPRDNLLTNNNTLRKKYEYSLGNPKNSDNSDSLINVHRSAYMDAFLGRKDSQSLQNTLRCIDSRNYSKLLSYNNHPVGVVNKTKTPFNMKFALEQKNKTNNIQVSNTNVKKPIRMNNSSLNMVKLIESSYSLPANEIIIDDDININEDNTTIMKSKDSLTKAESKIFPSTASSNSKLSTLQLNEKKNGSTISGTGIPAKMNKRVSLRPGSSTIKPKNIKMRSSIIEETRMPNVIPEARGMECILNSRSELPQTKDCKLQLIEESIKRQIKGNGDLWNIKGLKYTLPLNSQAQREYNRFQRQSIEAQSKKAEEAEIQRSKEAEKLRDDEIISRKVKEAAKKIINEFELERLKNDRIKLAKVIETIKLKEAELRKNIADQETETKGLDKRSFLKKVKNPRNYPSSGHPEVNLVKNHGIPESWITRTRGLTVEEKLKKSNVSKNMSTNLRPQIKSAGSSSFSASPTKVENPSNSSYEYKNSTSQTSLSELYNGVKDIFKMHSFDDEELNSFIECASLDSNETEERIDTVDADQGDSSVSESDSTIGAFDTLAQSRVRQKSLTFKNIKDTKKLKTPNQGVNYVCNDDYNEYINDHNNDYRNNDYEYNDEIVEETRMPNVNPEARGIECASLDGNETEEHIDTVDADQGDSSVSESDSTIGAFDTLAQSRVRQKSLTFKNIKDTKKLKIPNQGVNYLKESLCQSVGRMKQKDIERKKEIEEGRKKREFEKKLQLEFYKRKKKEEEDRKNREYNERKKKEENERKIKGLQEKMKIKERKRLEKIVEKKKIERIETGTKLRNVHAMLGEKSGADENNQMTMPVMIKEEIVDDEESKIIYDDSCIENQSDENNENSVNCVCNDDNNEYINDHNNDYRNYNYEYNDEIVKETRMPNVIPEARGIECASLNGNETEERIDTVNADQGDSSVSESDSTIGAFDTLAQSRVRQKSLTFKNIKDSKKLKTPNQGVNYVCNDDYNEYINDHNNDYRNNDYEYNDEIIEETRMPNVITEARDIECILNSRSELTQSGHPEVNLVKNHGVVSSVHFNNTNENAENDTNIEQESIESRKSPSKNDIQTFDFSLFKQKIISETKSLSQDQNSGAAIVPKETVGTKTIVSTSTHPDPQITRSESPPKTIFNEYTFNEGGKSMILPSEMITLGIPLHRVHQESVKNFIKQQNIKPTHGQVQEQRVITPQLDKMAPKKRGSKLTRVRLNGCKNDSVNKTHDEVEEQTLITSELNEKPPPKKRAYKRRIGVQNEKPLRSNRTRHDEVEEQTLITSELNEKPPPKKRAYKRRIGVQNEKPLGSNSRDSTSQNVEKSVHQ